MTLIIIIMNNPVRRAASLILCRQSHKLTSFYDYEVLLLERNVSLAITLERHEGMGIHDGVPGGQGGCSSRRPVRAEVRAVSRAGAHRPPVVL